MVELDPSDPDEGTSDDDLATALAQDMERAILHTASMNVVDGLPGRPARESLPLDVLASELATATGTVSAADITSQLEAQFQLRQREAAAFSQWATTMEELGTPDALAEISAARAEFSDVLADSDTSADDAPARDTPESDTPESDTLESDTLESDIEHDLRMAPGPMSAPILDIPPPPRLHPPQEPEELHALVEPEDAGGAQPRPPSEWSPVDDLFGISQTLGDIEPSTDSVLTDPVLTDPVSTNSVPLPFESEGEEPDGLLDIGDTDRELESSPISAVPSPIVSSGVFVFPETLVGMAPAMAPVFHSETAGVEPTVTEQRVGRAARLFWLWFAANSSVVSLVFGGLLLSLGMSLRQAIVATLAGVAISFLPLGLGTLAGKWSGQPTMVVSRAAFGHLGNILPAAIALVTRLFWGALLLWFLAAGTSRILVGANLHGPFSENQLTIVGLAVAFVLALVIAFFGYALIAQMQLVVSVISAILVVGIIVVTWPMVNLSEALTIGDGPWILVVTGAVLVFSFVGLVWAVSSADLARYQRPASSGGSAMLWSTFGATLPAFALIAYGALLAASNPDVATGLMERPLDTVALLIPVWYPIPLIAALALSLLSGIVISIYSGAFALQAVGLKLPRAAAVVIVGVALAGVALALALAVGDFTSLVRDVATSIAVPVSAWAGIFAAEMMIRQRGFDSASLVSRGGAYSDVRWINFIALIVVSVIGFGFTTASVGWLSWQGYLYPLIGVSGASDLAASDIGVFVALVLGLVTPIVAGIPAIRRQERLHTTGN